MEIVACFDPSQCDIMPQNLHIFQHFDQNHAKTFFFSLIKHVKITDEAHKPTKERTNTQMVQITHCDLMFESVAHGKKPQCHARLP